MLPCSSSGTHELAGSYRINASQAVVFYGKGLYVYTDLSKAIQ